MENLNVITIPNWSKHEFGPTRKQRNMMKQRKIEKTKHNEVKLTVKLQ